MLKAVGSVNTGPAHADSVIAVIKFKMGFFNFCMNVLLLSAIIVIKNSARCIV